MCIDRSVRVAAALVVSFALLGAARGDITSGLIGYWPLDGDGADLSGNGLDGTINGTVEPVPDRMGYAASAMSFPGEADSHVNVGDPPALNITGELTLAAWVFLNGDNANNGRIIAKSGAGGQRAYSLNVEASSGGVTNPATFQVALSGSTNVSILDTEPLPTDEWVHMAGVYRPGEVTEIYVNGELRNSNTTGIPGSQFSSNGLPLLIGARNACGNCGWDGLIDEARVYARALSPEDIEELVAFHPAPRVKAWGPDPADGANDVLLALLQWKPGVTAALHDVYFGTDPNLGAEDLVQSHNPVMLYYHVAGITPGTTYYWRVDEIERDMTTVHVGDVWSFLARPLTAYMPDPADGANDASLDPNMTVSWLPGLNAAEHHLYFGRSIDDVRAGAADTDKGTTKETTFAPGQLDAMTTYYWRVDEIDALGNVVAGPVWSITTYRPVDDFESYNDDIEAGTTVFDAWVDGWTSGTNGSVVGYFEAQNGTFGETSIVYGGGQSMPMDYNNVNSPYYSEAEHDFATAQDWTADGIDTLVLHIHGQLSNDAAPLYVGLADSSNHAGFVTHPDPEAATTTAWIDWKVPLSEFAAAGVNLSRIRTMYIGLGDRNATAPDGAGRIYVDEIWLTRPAPTPPDETAAQ